LAVAVIVSNYCSCTVLPGSVCDAWTVTPLALIRV